MFNIVLLCAGGASTGMLARKMEETSKEVGLEASVKAFGIGEAASKGAEADVIMLGPQVGYRQKEVQAACPGKPVCVIDREDYGRMASKKVLKQAVTTYRESRKA